MAVTAELVGALGGTQVVQTPVSGADPGGGGPTVLHTVEVPAGETWLIAVIGMITTDTYGATLRLGDAVSDAESKTTTAINSAVTVTATTTVELESSADFSFYSASFDGTVYTVPLEA